MSARRRSSARLFREELPEPLGPLGRRLKARSAHELRLAPKRRRRVHKHPLALKRRRRVRPHRAHRPKGGQFGKGENLKASFRRMAWKANRCGRTWEGADGVFARAKTPSLFVTKPDA